MLSLVHHPAAVESSLRLICTAESYAAALDRVAIVAATDTTGTIIYANEQFERISKYPRHELLGQNHRIVKSGHHPRSFFKHMYRTIARGDVWRGEIKNRAKDGSFYWVDTSIVPVRNARGKPVGYVSIRTDITRRKLAEEKTASLNTKLRRQNRVISHMAHYDALTDLPNRLLLSKTLKGALSADSGHGATAVLIVDLDRFRGVNETLGHQVGDALLKEVASRLRTCISPRDTVYRLGSDEFVVLQKSESPVIEGASLSKCIIEAMIVPFTIDCHRVSISASIGIAFANGREVHADGLLSNADLALYAAKNGGRGDFRFFAPEMDERLRTRRQLELDLRGALGKGELELDYQPLVELGNWKISGFEALLRWSHPVRGRLSPHEFIPIAEETGLIVPTGEWVLRQACTQAMHWPDHVKVAVNLSAVQFKGNKLQETVASALKDSGLPASRLELEITESVLMNNVEATLSTLDELRNLGVRIALDDFGTGYSSLSYLLQFPFDKIKIDRSFVAHLSTSKRAVSILETIIALAGKLDMITCVEGIETSQQLAIVIGTGCDEVQGHLFSRPVPGQQIAGILAQESGFSLG